MPIVKPMMAEARPAEEDCTGVPISKLMMADARPAEEGFAP
ncbi:hypothetical protein [Sphaerisporangium dianthi]